MKRNIQWKKQREDRKSIRSSSVILYQGTAKEFIETTESNGIVSALETAFRLKLGRKIPPAELSAYTNSLPYMGRVLRRSGVSGSCGVLVEYIIPNTSNRIDFVVAGEDDEGNRNFIIVELKQWTSAEVALGDGIVRTAIAGGLRETTHPSYQAHSYKLFLSDFNESISEGVIMAYACACLHNYPEKSPEPLTNDSYKDIVAKSPLFFRDDQEKLEDFVNRYVKNGKGENILSEINSGKIGPTKKLIEHVSELFQGNQAFVLLDEQKVSFEKARNIANNQELKSVVIIKGGPGTGKSVISVNLLGQLLKDGLNAVFVAPNSSFRNVMADALAQSHSRNRVRNLFKGSGGFVDVEPNTFDALVVDEAHRLKQKGAFMYQGKNQVNDIVRASKTSIFFIDDDQSIRPEDIGSISEIKKSARQFNAKVSEMSLSAQFRCSGSEGYINWLNDILHLGRTGNFDGWDNGTFDFQMFDDPNTLRDAIKGKEEDGFNARILAGYAWKWTSASDGNRNAEVKDVNIDTYDFSMPWNSRSIGTTWATDVNGIDQIGCIHTSQGLEFDYVGVIVGNDLTYNSDSMTYKTEHHTYMDMMGKRGLKDNPDELNRLVRNIYKILMTRGQLGCYVYFCDQPTNDYFESRLR